MGIDFETIEKARKIFSFVLNAEFLVENLLDFAYLTLHGHQEEVVEVCVESGNIDQ